MTAPIKKIDFLSSIRKDSYNLINLILAGIIICIFLYSAIYSPLKNNYPLLSFHDYLTGQKSISTGLSRGFSSIMRGNFAEARTCNIYCIRLFTFFLIQLLMRVLIFLTTWKSKNKIRNLIVRSDILISAGLFVYSFF